MKKLLLITLATMALIACNNRKTGEQARENGTIFYTEFDTPFGMPPFDKISFADFKPAFLKGMEDEAKEIDSIANNPEAPTFENTIAAMDHNP